jgi:hypothetical protein
MIKCNLLNSLKKEDHEICKFQRYLKKRKYLDLDNNISFNKIF